ncbi:MAG: sugar transferase [Anaerovoracaceae bacterium]|nr:sugar transferase [Anaerovoracaceae bacterium]
MRLKKWEDLPEFMRVDEVKPYYLILEKKKFSLVFKRVFDIIMSVILIVLFSPIMLLISLLIKFDSKGPIIYKQVRITQYGRRFKVYKFRTMVNDADKIGAYVTTQNDSRITRVGKRIRDSRLDEFPQLFNVLKGDMSFVGTRPEAVKYFEHYTDEMKATLLIPAGITSMASIMFKDEATILSNEADVDKTYIEKVLPQKMEYNLRSIEEFSLWKDLKTAVMTLGVVV